MSQQVGYVHWTCGCSWCKPRIETLEKEKLMLMSSITPSQRLCTGKHRWNASVFMSVYVFFFFSSIITVMYVEWTLGTKMFYNWGCGVRTKHSELSSVSVGYKGLGWRYFRWWGRPSDARWYYRSLLVAFHYLVFASWLRPINALHDSGGKRILRLPPELGYGMRGAGCRGGTSEWFSSCTNLIS